MYGGAASLAGPGWALLSLLAILPWLYARAGGRLSPRLLAEVAGAVYLAVLVGLTFFPLPLPPYQDLEPALAYREFLNPVPFATITESLSRGLYWPSTRFLVGNVVAFLPLGVLVALLARRPTWALAFLAGFATSAAIEAGQLGVSLAMGFPYRHADVDDVLLNVTGTMLGYAAVRPMIGRATKSRSV